MTRHTASDSSLARAVAERLSAALLPGDPPFTKPELAAAAALVLSAAFERKPGDPAIAIESVAGSAGERRMRVALVNDDMPFLVDSVAAAIAAEGLAIERLVHPVVHADRGKSGRLERLDESGPAESIIYLETRRADARTRRRLRGRLEATLADVRAAVVDWPKMREALERDAEALSEGEYADLLRWFASGMLTQLGHVVRRRDGKESAPLGDMRADGGNLLSAESYARAFDWFDQPDAAPVLIIKTNRLSQVHRRVPFDLIIDPLREHGRITALSVHAGIWTSAALAARPEDVPVIRTRLAELMDQLGFDPKGHAGKALAHALTELPHDLVIGVARGDLARLATAMMSVVDRPRPRLALLEVPLKRHLFAFVWLPRDDVSTALRMRIQRLLENAAQAKVLDWSLAVEGGNLALLRFLLDIHNGTDAPDEAALDAELQELVRGWPEAVESALADQVVGPRAAALALRYAEALPVSYRNAYGAQEAAVDVLRLHDLPSGRGVRLYQHRLDPKGELRLKVYQRGGSLDLSDIVPALENFGFRVIEEFPTPLDGGRMGSIHDFRIALASGVDPAAMLDRAGAVEAAVAAVLNGAAESDPFNRLVTVSGLAVGEADWLRAWYRYLRQTGLTFGIATAVDALASAPDVTRGLIDLFLARHDPARAKRRDSSEAAAQEAIRAGLAQVAAINFDRLLRAYHGVIEAILRTNAFVPAAGEALGFKLDSALVPGLPRPVPWREIFVYSRQVEGIHLRAGPIARGGIRWSDRRDDFRTEVLGLMKAQRVKNAVIVPTGAKGGFYPKQLPDASRDRDGWLAEGKGSYGVFIRTLLSLTDNLVEGKVVHPAGVVCRDGDDPYFVVAADKGTASYSDTANAIAESFDFWLDDAFASGGSKGYDHKAMGITAKGAWISVQRHFLELGTDIQTESIRVVGCGDMSGDVFGNGMLLSQALKLVAAYDHRHIFLDPDPDPAASFAERRRLFALPRSSWAGYDSKLISKGGGVFPRTQKQIPLSKEAQAALGIDAASLDPEALISAILRAPVDLLWFGGIGTYVKASTQNNAEVGDPANDVLRVNGREVRARVIGEGANLGVTQAGRIEFALRGAGGHGGKIDTDFIDNSAGVDCSDHEVNIKIALASAKRAGRLTEPGRVKLLAAMTDDVAALVLEDNRLQALALSIAEDGAAAALPTQIRLIDTLERSGKLDRDTEGLADSETLSRRASDGRGLTRPELAVVLSTAKLELLNEIEQSAVPDDPGLADMLLGYFPPAMRKKYREDILSHRLRREIIATVIANAMVNRLGLVNPFELAEEEGVGLGHVAAAFVAAERLFGMDELWRQLETAAMLEGARLVLFERAAQGLRTHMADLLRVGGAEFAPSELADRLGPAVTILSKSVGKLLSGEAHAQSDRMIAELEAAGAPQGDALPVVRLFDLDGAVGLAALAQSTAADPLDLARAFAELGSRLMLDWAQGTAARMSPSDPWERLLVAGLARDFQQMRLEFLRRMIGKGKTELSQKVERWADAHESAIGQFRAMIDRAEAVSPVSPAVLAQVAGQARNLLAR